MPALINDAADRAQEASVETRIMTYRLYRTCEESRDELQRVTDGAKEDMQRAAELFREDAGKLVSEIKSAASKRLLIGGNRDCH